MLQTPLFTNLQIIYRSLGLNKYTINNYEKSRKQFLFWPKYPIHASMKILQQINGFNAIDNICVENSFLYCLKSFKVLKQG